MRLFDYVLAFDLTAISIQLAVLTIVVMRRQK